MITNNTKGKTVKRVISFLSIAIGVCLAKKPDCGFIDYVFGGGKDLYGNVCGEEIKEPTIQTPQMTKDSLDKYSPLYQTIIDSIGQKLILKSSTNSSRYWESQKYIAPLQRYDIIQIQARQLSENLTIYIDRIYCAGGVRENKIFYQFVSGKMIIPDRTYEKLERMDDLDRDDCDEMVFIK